MVVSWHPFMYDEHTFPHFELPCDFITRLPLPRGTNMPDLLGMDNSRVSSSVRVRVEFDHDDHYLTLTTIAGLCQRARLKQLTLRLLLFMLSAFIFSLLYHCLCCACLLQWQLVVVHHQMWRSYNP